MGLSVMFHSPLNLLRAESPGAFTSFQELTESYLRLGIQHVEGHTAAKLHILRASLSRQAGILGFLADVDSHES